MQTETAKKTISPEFNELFTIPVHAEQLTMSRLVVQVCIPFTDKEGQSELSQAYRVVIPISRFIPNFGKFYHSRVLIAVSWHIQDLDFTGFVSFMSILEMLKLQNFYNPGAEP